MTKLPRPSSEADRLALKSATQGALKTCGGGGAFALMTRLEATRLSNAGNPQQPEVFLPLDVVLDADLAAGAPIITAALAGLMGFDLVAKDEAARAMDAEALTLTGLARLAKELGDVAPVLILALADRHISAAERRDALREIDQALAVLNAARMALAHNPKPNPRESE